jgi:hypothetical protein
MPRLPKVCEIKPTRFTNVDNMECRIPFFSAAGMIADIRASHHAAVWEFWSASESLNTKFRLFSRNGYILQGHVAQCSGGSETTRMSLLTSTGAVIYPIRNVRRLDYAQVVKSMQINRFVAIATGR